MKFQIELTNGAINNSYINLRGHLDKFMKDHLSCLNTQKYGRPLKLDLGGGDILETDICSKHKRFRNRTALKKLNMLHAFKAGDKLTIEQGSGDLWKVYK